MDRRRAGAAHLYATKAFAAALEHINGGLADIDRVMAEQKSKNKGSTGGDIRKQFLDMAARCCNKLGDHTTAARHLGTVEQVPPAATLLPQ